MMSKIKVLENKTKLHRLILNFTFSFFVLTFTFCISDTHAGIITDAPRLSTVLVKTLNFLLSVVGTIAIIGLIAAGVMYLTSAGSERRIEVAKKAFWYSVVGIVIAMGGWILIKTIAAMINGN